MSDKILSENENKLLAYAWQCFKAGPPDIDWEKLAKLAGHANHNSTRNAFNRIKQKLQAIADGAGAVSTDKGRNDADIKNGINKAASAMPGGQTRHQRATAGGSMKRKLSSDDQADEDDDEEDKKAVIKVVPATKARGRGKAVPITAANAAKKSKFTAVAPAAKNKKIKIEVDSNDDKDDDGSSAHPSTLEHVSARTARDSSKKTATSVHASKPDFPGSLSQNKKDGTTSAPTTAQATKSSTATRDGITVAVQFDKNKNNGKVDERAQRMASRERSREARDAEAAAETPADDTEDEATTAAAKIAAVRRGKRAESIKRDAVKGHGHDEKEDVHDINEDAEVPV